MTVEEATKLTEFHVVKQRVRSLQNMLHQTKEAKVLGWEDNLFYQWVKYSTRQVSLHNVSQSKEAAKNKTNPRSKDESM